MSWTPRQRLAAVLAGEPADRPLVSLWRHCREAEYPGGPLAEWTIEFARRWDWDWIKLNPRATYYGEIWGNQYRDGDYEQRDIPRQIKIAVNRLDDLDTIETIPDSPVLTEQVQLTREVAAAIPQTPVFQTLFSPVSTLIQLAGLSYYPGKPVFGLTGQLSLRELFIGDRERTARALQAITSTYLWYLDQLRAAGADGIFYAVTATANPQIMSAELFDELSAPYDRQLMEAAGELAVIVHTCGDHSDPGRFTGWGSAVSWDQYADGNPPLDGLDKTVVVGGVDHRRFAETELVAAQTAAAAELARTRPVLVAPTCSVHSTAATDASLEALVSACRKPAE